MTQHRTGAQVIAAILLLSPCVLRGQEFSLDRLAIQVRGKSREFAYTNKESAFFYGETNSSHRNSWQGFWDFGVKFLDDYDLLIDGVRLPRSSAAKTTVYPDYLERTYPGGLIEQLRPVDGVPMFALIVTAQRPVEVGIIPYFSDGRSENDYVVDLREGCALIARRAHTVRTTKADYPVWLAIQEKDLLPAKRDARRGRLYSPVGMADRRSKTHMIAFAIADDEDSAAALAEEYAPNAAQFFRQRRWRMESLLRETAVRTGDKRFDEALAWAKLSLDALVMHQRTRGIFAGLPWFDDYWGRDTFISLPGAALATGQFTLAKEILQSFATYQETDSASSSYGRIPNIVTTTSKAYNTADGTPRFVMMAKEYIERSADTTFLLEIYPTVLRSIEGTLRYHVDSLGFLVHADAETWMDAVGPGGPWSPRGNRANDIQALWAGQLGAGVWFATRVGDVAAARAWHAAEGKVTENFARYFIKRGVIADHLNPDGTQNTQLRPNQIFDAPLLDQHMRAVVTRLVTDALAYPYGVASLSQDDPDFHPFHQYPQCYPKDAAYHNGAVWTWLQGPLISELCHFSREEVAWELTQNGVHQILDRGAVGTESELIDAVPRQGEPEPRLSGTFSQAWSLAEFIRNSYDDYLGIRFDALDRRLTIAPHMPAALGTARAMINEEGRSLPVEIEQHGDAPYVTLDARNLRSAVTVFIDLSLGVDRTARARFTVEPRAAYRFTCADGKISVTRDGKFIAAEGTIAIMPNYDADLLPLEFVAPIIHPGLKAMRGPAYPLLSHAEAKASNPAAQLLVDASDPAGDDTGAGGYTYPRGSNFVSGMFDITHFTVRSDSVNAYFLLTFRALTDPGWHPEYGFQLTEAAIAIDQDGVRGSGGVAVGHNSGFSVDSSNAFERLIVIGGGVQLEDGHGKILAAYVPVDQDAGDPIGNALEGTISFALPVSLLGRPSSTWSYTIIAGGQDDHGGAGLGEFRTVQEQSGEWNGGGKRRSADPNVYDILIIPRR